MPDGVAGEFFEIFGGHAPPPPGALPPVLWGSEEHVRELFGERVDSLEPRRTSTWSGVPAARTSTSRSSRRGSARSSRSVEPRRRARSGSPRSTEDFLEFAERANRAAGGEPPNTSTSTCSWSPEPSGDRATPTRAGSVSQALLLGRPTELDGEQVVQLGARERAVALTRGYDGQPLPQVVGEEAAYSLRLVRHAIVQQSAAELGGEGSPCPPRPG